MATVVDFLTSLREVVRPADLIDILVIAICIYFAILWLLQRASRGVVVGLSLITFVYLMARQLDMVLTSWLFQVGFTAILIGLILVFQRDIRSVFERLAAMIGIIDRSAGVPAGTAETVARALAELARQKIGAMVVLPGRASLDPHVHGGYALDGRLSEPLLASIFDPSSHGHDGAMIVTGDRVTAFGVHLPLSENLAELDGYGTRHAAALGLSEVTDALVLVVSEERGTLSIAHDGRIRRVGDAEELQTRIESFIHETGSADRQRKRPLATVAEWMRPAVLHHWPTKLLSVGLAFLLWLTVAYRVEPVVRQLAVPVEFHDLPETLQIKDVSPEVITLTLSGPKHRFALLDTDKLRISLDLSDTRPGKNVRAFRQDQVDIPADHFTISDFSPDSVSFTVEPRPLPRPSS
jgi:uncharacterized protein (TIGR00159 family)